MALSPLGCNLLFMYNRYNFCASVMLADYDTILPNFMFVLRNVCSSGETFLPMANLVTELLMLHDNMSVRTSVDLQDDGIEYVIDDACLYSIDSCLISIVLCILFYFVYVEFMFTILLHSVCSVALCKINYIYIIYCNRRGALQNY
jgi:hypothetical protein